MSTRTIHPKHATESTKQEETTTATADSVAIAQPIPPAPQPDPNAQFAKLTIVLSNSTLETIKVREHYELVTADAHANILKKLNKDPTNYRPDILHQSLLTLLDSPLNKAGFLKVYIETTSKTLIEVNPNTRIPRTYKRFSGLIVQLLRDLKIRSADGKETLFKVIKNPVTQYFAPDALKLEASVTGTLTNIAEFIEPIEIDKPIVMMVGAHAHGLHSVEWAEQSLALSRYPCSASIILGRVCNAFENQLGVL